MLSHTLRYIHHRGFDMIRYQVEKFTDILDEVKPLLELHWKEIALNQDKIKLNPDWDSYRRLEEAGILQIVTARESGSNQLVGYSADFISRSLHYSDHTFAINDLVFIHPDYRVGRVALGLFAAVEEELKIKCVSLHVLHMKVEHSFERLADYLGYKKVEYNYSKYLGA